MFSAPDDATEARMHTARDTACKALTVWDAGEPLVWGYGGRTLSGAVMGAHGRRWLRLVAEHPDRAHGKLWEGPKAAQEQIPADIPRPVLHSVHDWQEGGWSYRAEEYEYAETAIISPSPVLERDPALPDAWWADLHTALTTLAAIPTERVAVREQYIRRAVPEFTGYDVDAIEWSTAHGDFHWSNLGGPDLRILDWEGWGTAPVGFDVAQLYIYALHAPQTAARVRQTFAHILDNPAVRVAKLTICAQVLQAADRTPFYASLSDPVRAHLKEMQQEGS